MNKQATQSIHAILKSRFGHDEFRPLQEDIIGSVLAGEDTLVLMPTGGGKSLCYQLPAVCMDGLTLVVSPLISLMKDQVDALKAAGIPAEFINSTLTGSELGRVHTEAAMGRLKMVYLAPERLALQGFRDFLSSLSISLIAIDEAHCISEWGHDFRPDYRNLKFLRSEFEGVPVMGLTATATERVRVDIAEQLGLRRPRTFVSSFNRANLTYSVQPKQDSFEALLALLREHPGEPTIIYCFSRRETEELASELSAKGFRALPYHAGLENRVRRETQEGFIRGEMPIVAATIAFGMGIDKPDVRLVVHYDLPKSVEFYYQETGRAGRDGLPSECVLFYSYGDKFKQDLFIDKIEDGTEREMAQRKLAQMIDFCQLRSCRRRYLLNYFGEEWEQDNCGACDVCLTQTAEFDATEIAQKVLSAVIRTGERFGEAHVSMVLRGSRAKRVLELGHDRLSVHGVARDFSREELREITWQLVNKGLLAKADGEYPTLYVTPAGGAFLKNRDELRLDMPKRAVPVIDPPDGDGPEPDEALFEEFDATEIAEKLLSAVIHTGERFGAAHVIRVLRGSNARKVLEMGHDSLSVYGVAPDFTREGLKEIIWHLLDRGLLARGDGAYPTLYLTTAGRGFLRRTERLTLRMPKSYSRKDARRRRGAVGRRSQGDTHSETKRLLLEGMNVGEIATHRGLSQQTVLSHLERLVETGEELELAHLMPPAHRFARIEAALRYADAPALRPIRERLGEGFSYEELRLVRLHLRQARSREP